MTIIAAADGSSLGNPGPAGWAWFIDETCWHAGGWPQGTNNQGELMAVLDLLLSTRHRAEEELHILCDSQYVINSLTKWMPGWKKRGWKKGDGKPVLNTDLMRQLDTELRGRPVRFTWVKGHAGHPLNEAADSAARAVATAYQHHQPIPEGPGFPGAGSTSAGNGSGSGAGSSAVRGGAAVTTPQSSTRHGAPSPTPNAAQNSAPTSTSSSAAGTQDTLF
ncbi:ribonuclease H family protein [Lawsonella clevelandensis]|uniref:Ribonuclease H n=1 Tax=Lawsonella clevelandensis TaxID=1528099 RepID=A0A5E3ZWS9_9ACTN|nr:Ribonuclease HI [Lawsonella clevelandensis]